MRRCLTFFLVLVSTLGWMPVAAEPPAAVEATSEVELKKIVDRLVIDFAARRAAEAERVDAEKRTLFDQLKQKDGDLRQALKEKGLSAKRAQALEAELAGVDAERQKLIDQLAEQDRRFGQEVAEYRRNVASIANSPDPRKKAALKRYAAGDRRGAYTALREIQLAENKAVAAGWREIASLGLDLKDRGESTTDQVISDLEVVRWLDPEDGWVLIELTRLYIEAGRLEDARRAAEEGLKRATGERDRAVGSLELANLLVKLRDYEKARDYYQSAVDLFRGLAKADPSNQVFLRDLSTSLFHFANLLMKQRDMASARKNLTESLAIATFLARQPLLSTTSEQDLSAILIKMGDLLALQDDLVLARRFYEQTLDINNRLARESPSSLEAKYELTVTFDRLGNVSIREGRQQEARASFEQSLKIREQLASVDSSNAQFQHGLLVSRVQMFLVTRDGAYRTAATNLAKRLETEGRLTPDDQTMVDLLEKISSAREGRP